MSTATQERPVAQEVDVDVVVTSKNKPVKTGKKVTTKRVVVREDISFARRAAKRAKKAAKKARGWMRKALKWAAKNAKKAYRRAMAAAKAAARWTRAKAISGAGLVASAATTVWDKAAAGGAWAWSYIRPAIAWMSPPIKAAIAGVTGFAVVATVGPTVVYACAIAGIAYLLFAGRFTTTKVVKVKDKKPSKKANKQVIEIAHENGLNTAQESSLGMLLAELMNERDQKADKGTSKQVWQLNGQIHLVRARVTGDTRSRKDLFAEYKQIMADEGEDFDKLSFSTGMRIAESKVNQLLVEHQTETIVVEA
jgi:hypothetical protein